MACTAFCNETVNLTYGLWLEAQLKISSLLLKYENIIQNQRIDLKYHSLPMALYMQLTVITYGKAL